MPYKKTPRLSPAEQRRFLGVADNWGPLFELYWDLQYMAAVGLTRRPTESELAAHLEGLKAEEAKTRLELIEAATEGDYKKAEELAGHAVYVAGEIADFDEDHSNLATLSDAGLAYAAKLRAKRAARAAEAK